MECFCLRVVRDGKIIEACYGTATDALVMGAKLIEQGVPEQSIAVQREDKEGRALTPTEGW